TVSGESHGTDYSFSYSRLDSAGLRPGPFNHSQTRENHYSARVGHRFGDPDDPRVRVQSTFNASEQNFEIPFDFPGAFNFFAIPDGLPKSISTYDPNNSSRRIFFTSTNQVIVKATDWWKSELRFSLTQNRKEDRNQLDGGLPFPFLFGGPFLTNLNRTRTAETTVEAEWLNHLTWEGKHWKNILTFGYLFEQDHVAFRDFSTIATFGSLPPLHSTVSATRIRNAHYYQDQLALWDRLFLNAGFRVDQESQDAHLRAPGVAMPTHLHKDSLFGVEYTPRFSAALDLPEVHAKLHGAWSRNFHAPSLLDLYFPNFSNSDLKPEIGKSAEGGVTFSFLEDRLGGDITYFRTDFTNLIQFVLLPPPEFFDIRNVGTAKTEGLEISAWAGPWKGVKVSGNYTFLDSRDDENKPLQRRPRHKFNATLAYTYKRFAMNVDFNLTGRQRDSFNFIAADGGLRVGDLRGWHRLDFAATYDLLRDRGPLEKLQLYTRVNNAFDSSFEQVKGFPDAGTTAFAGIRGSF
ncbi:MAG TPA: TonB-dependent receptor, partial [Thermoplasmata archaeon]|nr:TonB-dependent receptor [Thermoplasmata archaeon]